MEDAQFGWDLCRKISQLDIGQAIAVLDKDVIAVEAIEGTNNMIERAGNLCKTGGWTLIKVANSQQDMRMDVPTIGVTTIEKLAAARAGLELPATSLTAPLLVAIAVSKPHGVSTQPRDLITSRC